MVAASAARGSAACGGLKAGGDHGDQRGGGESYSHPIAHGETTGLAARRGNGGGDYRAWPGIRHLIPSRSRVRQQEAKGFGGLQGGRADVRRKGRRTGGC